MRFSPLPVLCLGLLAVVGWGTPVAAQCYAPSPSSGGASCQVGTCQGTFTLSWCTGYSLTSQTCGGCDRVATCCGLRFNTASVTPCGSLCTGCIAPKRNGKSPNKATTPRRSADVAQLIDNSAPAAR